MFLSKRNFNSLLKGNSPSWYQAAQNYKGRWTDCVHKGEKGNLDLPIHMDNLRKQINSETMKNFWINGYAVFHDVYDPKTIQILKDEMAKIVDDYDMEADEIEDFETKNNNRASYFMNSAWQMKPFFEEDAKDKQGNLVVPKNQAFNKVGHAMHDLHPVFESFSYSQVVKTLCKEIMLF